MSRFKLFLGSSALLVVAAFLYQYGLEPYSLFGDFSLFLAYIIALPASVMAIIGVLIIIIDSIQ